MDQASELSRSPFNAEKESQRERHSGACMARIASGDSSELQHLYDSYAELLYCLAAYILGDVGEAEDVVAEVFVHVWQQADRFDGRRGSLKGWLVMLTRSRALDRLRSSQRREVLLTRLNGSAAADVEESWTAASLLNRSKRVTEAMAQLPARQQHVLRLAFFAGLSHSEIAEYLKEPLGTVKSRIRSALLNMRDRLEPLERG